MATTTPTFLGMSNVEWGVIISATALMVTLIGGFLKVLAAIKKQDPKLIKELPHDAETIGDDILKFIQSLAKTPWFAAKAAKEKLQAHHVIDQLTELELQQSALKGVSVFNKALGVKLADMTQSQKMDLSEFVKADLGAKVKVTDGQIVAALKWAQDSEDSVEAAVVPAVQAHEASLKAWASLNAPKDDVSKTTQNPPADNGQAPATAVS